jgi:hypothetical protein
MRSFKAVAAQGEVTIIRLGPVPADRKLPDGCKPMQPENDRYVIGHSETGHHHVIGAAGATVGVLARVPEGMRILRAILENPTSLDHLRDFDTHESIVLDPGEYEFRICREFDPYAGIGRLVRD